MRSGPIALVSSWRRSASTDHDRQESRIKGASARATPDCRIQEQRDEDLDVDVMTAIA
jgi:hypothetical protein